MPNTGKWKLKTTQVVNESVRFGTVVKEFEYKLPLGDHWITVPVGTSVSRRDHSRWTKEPVWMVRDPAMLKSEDPISELDAASFGVYVPAENIYKKE